MKIPNQTHKEYKLLYSYMTTDKVEKATVPPKDCYLNDEYLKNSLSNSYWDKLDSDEC